MLKKIEQNPAANVNATSKKMIHHRQHRIVHKKVTNTFDWQTSTILLKKDFTRSWKRTFFFWVNEEKRISRRMTEKKNKEKYSSWCERTGLLLNRKKWCCVKWIWREELRQQSFYNAVDVSFKQKRYITKILNQISLPCANKNDFLMKNTLKLQHQSNKRKARPPTYPPSLLLSTTHQRTRKEKRKRNLNQIL